MNRPRAETWYRLSVSVFVLGLLSAQALTLPITATGATFLRSKLFPIIEYPMYAPAHYEGERVTATWRLEGILPDGRTVDITRQEVGLSIWDYNRIIQTMMRRRPGALSDFVKVMRVRAPRGGELREIRIYSHGMQLTRDGPKEIASELVMTVPLPPDA